MDELRFGTDGWRDRIGERFTTANVRRAAHATAGWLKGSGTGSGTGSGAGSVVVAHDTRFGGPMFARAAADALAANGLVVYLAQGPLPTPVLSFAVRHLGAGAGVMLTASHNPPAWNGYKLKGAYGGTATQDAYREVAERVVTVRPEDVPDAGPDAPALRPLDVRDAYFAHLATLLDLGTLRTLRGRLVHDAMGGAAASWMAGFARYARLSLEVEELRADPDPMFHGAHPEPIPAHMGPLLERMRRDDALLGIATDGDGDRLAAVLPGGRPVNSHEIFALLLDQRFRSGARGRVVKTVTVARLVERIAASRGVPVTETPVGFKWLVDEMLRGDVLIAGEESGGIGVPEHLPERDGIANGFLLTQALAEALAEEQVEEQVEAQVEARGEGSVATPGEDGRSDAVPAGGPLAARLAALEREAAWRHHYDRTDLSLRDDAALQRVMDALSADPERFAGRDVDTVERRDGVKLNLAGRAWLLIRASGTEPLLRLYCEAQSADEVRELLADAERFVRTAAG